MSLNRYINTVYEKMLRQNPGETEFHHAVKEVLENIEPLLEERPEYVESGIIERIVEPERVIMFRVPWEDDNGDYHVNRGYRVEFNSALGPYKGGLRFHASVNLSVLKFLAFEQIFKNSLTSMAIGGGKGGSDFSPKGKTVKEIMRFCQSFMTEMYRHIGPNTDVPAGDIGVGSREIGFLFGQYKRLKNEYTGVFTGKGPGCNGSLIRPEATGFGAVYFAEHMLGRMQDEIKGKRISVSGFGNVAWGVVTKVNQLGGKVVTISGPDGFVYDPDGIKDEKIEYMLELRDANNDIVEPYAEKFGVEFYSGKKPWHVPVDIAMPCATEGELDMSDAKELVKNECKILAEVSNMGCSTDAAEYLSKNICFAPGKAVNAGGVAVSGLEMSQNSMRQNWSKEEVEGKLKQIMTKIHGTCIKYGEEGNSVNYLKGANIGGFVRVADAMLEQGLV